MVLNELVPRDIRSTFLTSLQRITQPITDFIRGNPIVSTAVIGIGTTGLVAVARTVRRRRKKKATRKKRVTKRRATRKRTVKRKKKRVTHRSPRHKGHKRVSFTSKDGKRVSFLVRRKTSPRHRRRRK